MKAPAKKAPATRAQPSPPREQELSQEEVDAKAEMLFPGDVIIGTLVLGFICDICWESKLFSKP